MARTLILTAMAVVVVATIALLWKLPRLFARNRPPRTSVLERFRGATRGEPPASRASAAMMPERRAIGPGDATLVYDAHREWPDIMNTNSSTTSPPVLPHGSMDGCTDRMQLYGLCDASLLQVPKPRPTSSAARQRPFVFLHLSKCAGTSLVSQLSYLGYAHYSLFLPPDLSRSSKGCGAAASKCCWWLERLGNMSAAGRNPRFLTQEPGNEAPTVSPSGVLEIDPAFDAARDLCAELSYVTVLRPPVARVASHMCERGISFDAWQDPRPGPLSVKLQLRDNYMVRSLGGARAWAAPEGTLGREHLLAAAQTLARFDVVMTVATIAKDSPAQMGRVGLPGFRWPREQSRSRAENLRRAQHEPGLRTSGRASCEVPPTMAQLERLVAASTWDAALYDFAKVLAARRTAAYADG